VVRLPHDISPGARSRRALLADILLALALALAAILLAAGIGVVGFAALGVFIVVGGWIVVEWLIHSISRRRPGLARARSASSTKRRWLQSRKVR
jgi:hypothetical protein